MAAGLVIGVAVTVVTQVMPISSLDGDRTVLRGRIGSGADIDQLDNPLVGFRRYTPQNDGSPDNVFDKTLFVVSGLEESTAMRFVTLDHYDGNAWRADNRTVADAEDDLFQRIGSEVSASLPGEDVEVSIEMRGAYTGAWLPLVGQLTGIEFDFADGRAQREDVRYNPATSSAMVVGGLGPGDDYSFTASVPNTRLARNSQAYPVDEPLQPAGQRSTTTWSPTSAPAATRSPRCCSSPATSSATVATATAPAPSTSHRDTTSTGSRRSSSARSASSATTSSTPPSWRWRPTGCGSPRGSWWGLSRRRQGPGP